MKKADGPVREQWSSGGLRSKPVLFFQALMSSSSSRRVVEVVRLGLLSYQEALQLQQLYVRRHLSAPAHALLLCQHPPVYTTGIRGGAYPAAVLERLRLLGAEVQHTNRGGLITFHGPGQLVCYPILNLSSFKKVSSGVGGGAPGYWEQWC